MKFVITFVAAFALTAGVVVFARVTFGEAPEAKDTAQASGRDGSDSKKPEDDEHAQHQQPDTEKPPVEPEEEPTEKPPEEAKDFWADAVKVDLKNAKDPVNGKDITDDNRLTVVYDGFKVHLDSARSVKKFKRRPVEYLVPLELEMDADGTVKQVKPSDFIAPPIIPEACPMMGSDIDPEGEVFIFHRGYKIYFCCWSGCAGDFLAKPEYAVYGLKDQDGKLVPIE